MTKRGIIVSLTQPLRGGLSMTEKENNIRRLKTIEGHIRGVQRMIDDDIYCIDVIRQVNAIQAALNKISINILDSHLNSCLISAIRGDDSKATEKVLREIVDVFEAATKV